MLFFLIELNELLKSEYLIYTEALEKSNEISKVTRDHVFKTLAINTHLSGFDLQISYRSLLIAAYFGPKPGNHLFVSP
jgi:hypothetical protein